VNTFDSDPIREFESLKSIKPDVCLVRFSKVAVNHTQRLYVSWQTFAKMLKYILEGKYLGTRESEEMLDSLKSILEKLIGEPLVNRLVGR